MLEDVMRTSRGREVRKDFEHLEKERRELEMENQRLRDIINLRHVCRLHTEGIYCFHIHYHSHSHPLEVMPWLSCPPSKPPQSFRLLLVRFPLAFCLCRRHSLCQNRLVKATCCTPSHTLVP